MAAKKQGTDREKSKLTVEREASAAQPLDPTQRGWYRLALSAPGAVLVMLVPLVGDPQTGATFDPDAPKPSLVKLTYETYVYYGELDVDSDEPREAVIDWHMDFDTEIDLFATKVRPGRKVTARSVRHEGDKVVFDLRDIARLA